MRRNEHTPSGSAVHAETPGFADVGERPLGGDFETAAGSTGRPPNIVMVLEESAFDPRRLGLPVGNAVAEHFAPPQGLSGALDIAYLPGVVLAAAAIEPDRIFAAHQELMRRCGGAYAGCGDPLKGAIHRTLIEEELVEVDATLPTGRTGGADARPSDALVEFAGHRP